MFCNSKRPNSPTLDEGATYYAKHFALEKQGIKLQSEGKCLYDVLYTLVVFSIRLMTFFTEGHFQLC